MPKVYYLETSEGEIIGLTSAGQRGINLLYEGSEKQIAILSIGAFSERILGQLNGRIRNVSTHQYYLFTHTLKRKQTLWPSEYLNGLELENLNKRIDSYNCMVYSKPPDSIPIVDFNDFKQRKRLAHLFTFSFSDKITNFSFRLAFP